MSVLLRQPHGFEGLGAILEELNPAERSSLAHREDLKRGWLTGRPLPAPCAVTLMATRKRSPKSRTSSGERCTSSKLSSTLRSNVQIAVMAVVGPDTRGIHRPGEARCRDRSQ